MGKKDKTSITFLLDQSGSMMSCFNETITGFNEYIQALKKQKNISFTLTKFNSEAVKIAYTDKPIEDVKELSDKTYQPNGMTPLYDAIGKTAKKLTDALVKRKDKPKVLFVIMTDGFENASSEYKLKAIKELIKVKEKDDWNFVFMGSDKDGWLNAKAMGISAGNSILFAQSDTRKTMHRAGGMSASFASGGKRKTKSFFK